MLQNKTYSIFFFKTQVCAVHEKQVFLNSRDDQRERAGTGVWYYERLA